MSETREGNSHSAAPLISANAWYKTAIVAGSCALFMFAVGFVWVFMNGEALNMHQRAQALTPFGAAMIAIVTFFTVAWRGVQTDQQLRQQAEQVDLQNKQLGQVIRQNDAKEEENLVKVLQEGAKLIADPDKPSQVLAGISSLEYLIMTGKEPFNIQAADLVANLLLEEYGPKKFNRIIRAALNCLQKCEERGVTPTISGIFKAPEDNQNPHVWVYIPAIANINIECGAIGGNALHKMEKRIDNLHKVRIWGGSYDTNNIIFSKCTFFECIINSATSGSLDRNNYEYCDFSSAIIKVDDDDVFTFNDFKHDRNYYKIGSPPKDTNGLSLAKYFLTEAQAIRLLNTIPD